MKPLPRVLASPRRVLLVILLLVSSIAGVALAYRYARREWLIYKALHGNPDEAVHAVRALRACPGDRTTAELHYLVVAAVSEEEEPVRAAAAEVLLNDRTRDNSASLSLALDPKRPLAIRLTVARALAKAYCSAACLSEVYGELKHLWIEGELVRLGANKPPEGREAHQREELKSTLLTILDHDRPGTVRVVELRDNLSVAWEEEMDRHDHEPDAFAIWLAGQLKAKEFCFLLERFEHRTKEMSTRLKVRKAKAGTGCKEIL